MTCKDSWKETGLFSLEDAGDRSEEQLDAPQRAVSVGFQLCSRRNHMAGAWSNRGVQEEGLGRDCPQKGSPALTGGLKISFHQHLKTFSPGVFPVEAPCSQRCT